MHDEFENFKGTGHAEKAGAKNLAESQPDEPSYVELEESEMEKLPKDYPAELQEDVIMQDKSKRK